MEISLTTPALLFPAISLLLLAYTNRFLGLAALIRNLHDKYMETRDALIIGQIENLRHRVILIRNMQVCGAFSMFLCAACMFALFKGLESLGKKIFGCSLIFFMISLALSMREIWISVRALNLNLSDLEAKQGEKP